MLHHKVAVITGSTSGIGLGIAQGLAKADTHVVLNGYGAKAEIERVRGEIAAQTGVKVVYHGADMSKPDEVAALIPRSPRIARQRRYPGQQCRDPEGCAHRGVSDRPVGRHHRHQPFLGLPHIRAAVPGMKAKHWGRINNIASAHALVASPFKSAYVTAKHGLLGLTKTVALELAEAGITCNAICPGYVRTPLVEGQIKDTAKARGITEEQVIRGVMLGEQPTKWRN